MSTIPGVRPELAALPTYALELAECRFKLDQNEMPWDLPQEVKEGIRRRLEALDFARYPDFHGDSLARVLATYHGHDPAGVLVGNGSNELLAAALTLFGGPEGEVLALAPCFSLYRPMTLASGARLRVLGPRPDLRLPVDELLAEVEANPRRPVILTTPNNPTGEGVSPEWVEALLEKLEAPLLLDNAYGEFCGYDYRPLLARFSHLLLFRTFSKAWSLAAVRLGYVLTSPALVELLKKVKLPYNVGAVSVAAGEECLAHSDLLEERVRRVIALRPFWADALTARGFEVWPSEANFVLVRCPEGDAGRVWRGLASRSVRVRDFSSAGGSSAGALAGCLRISIGDEAALAATLQALDEIFEEAL